MGASKQLDRVGAGVEIGLRDCPAQRADGAVGLGRVGGVSGHQALPVRLLSHAGCQRGLDGAGLHLQRPVAPARGRAGGVGAGRDIGAGQRCQVAHQALPERRLRQVAAVQQDVGVGAQRSAPGRHLACALQQGIGIQPRATQLHDAVAAMRQHVNGGDVVAPRQGGTDHRQTILPGFNGDDLDRPSRSRLRAQVGQQGGAVGQRGIDERDFVGLRLHFSGKLCIL